MIDNETKDQEILSHPDDPSGSVPQAITEDLSIDPNLDVLESTNGSLSDPLTITEKPEQTFNNEKQDMPCCAICHGDGPWYGCQGQIELSDQNNLGVKEYAKCGKMVCNSCLSDLDPTLCKLCGNPNLEFTVSPLIEETLNEKTGQMDKIVHHGRLFIPVGTAMMTTCGKISAMSDELLEKNLEEYAGFVKEAEEALDRRKVTKSMLQNEKADRKRKKGKSGISGSLDYTVQPPTTLSSAPISGSGQTTSQQAQNKPKTVKSTKQDAADALKTLMAAGLTMEQLKVMLGGK